MRIRLFVVIALSVIVLAGCNAVAKPDAVPSRQQAQPSRPQLVDPVEAERIVSAVEGWELDSRLKVAVRDGIDLLVSNTTTSFHGWDVYYVKYWAVRLNDGSMYTNPDRKLYWAVARFGTGNGEKRAIISVEGNTAGTQIMPWGPCNEEADIVMSRIFGGPSFGSEEFIGTRCTSVDGTTAEAFVR